mmetsp:Transcript_67726/g.214368  ORF Transcript_67726/g.214368 Transcript_67726/m.214368 type:complete len:150 (-) Transcript_67726:398-847(-)
MVRAELFMIPAAKVVTLPVTADLKLAADLLLEHHIGCIVITKDETVEGIVTKSDLIRAVFKEGRSWDSTSITDVMVKDVVAVKPETQRDDVAKMLMDKHLHHAVVKGEAGQFLGVVSAWDVVREAALDAKAFPYNREYLQSSVNRPRVW